MDNRPTLRFPYVLFDLGSTLIYFDGDWQQVMADALRACTHALREFGYELDDHAFPQTYYALIQEYYQQRNDYLIEFTAEHVLREVLSAHSVPSPRPEHVLSALQAMYAVSQRYWHVEPDAHATLQALRSAGCHLGIISNASDDADVQVLVDKSEIRHYFDFVHTSAAAGVRKPHPLIFQQALANWVPVMPQQVLMVGDMRSADMAGANQMGMASAWITRRAADEGLPPDDPRYQPTFTISTLSELPRII